MSIGLTEAQLDIIPGSMFIPVGLVEQPARDRLQVSYAEIAQRISAELDDLANQILTAPTVEDFAASRDTLFPSYVKLSQALGNIILAKLDKAELPGLVDASLAVLKAEVASKAALYFGDDAVLEILFAISTLKSAYRWIPHLMSGKVANESRLEDIELARNFTGAAMWSNFHLTALVRALRNNQTIIPEILHELLDGLRSSVMVYAFVRAALDLRNIPYARYSEGLETSWDAEDEALANAD
jgi:hypothetical protein